MSEAVSQFFRVHTRCRDALVESELLPLFDADWLQQQDWIIGQSSTGRGLTTLFQYRHHRLVLRPYRRGGLVRHLSTSGFIWTGLPNTRPWLEFELLLRMREQGLPCPVPFACQVVRHGVAYSGALLMHEIAEAQSLAQVLTAREIGEREWSDIGACIRRFHDASVYHSDLNANNILLDAEGRVHLIDFDKSCYRSGAGQRWKSANLERLQRSITKCQRQADSFYFKPANWSQLTAGYCRT